jgi:uncharacterized SAM-binding protein YcdF (DUF218 family)
MLNTLFFYASKIIWALLSPATLIYLLLILGIALLYFKKIQIAKKLLATVAVFLTLIAILPLGLWLASPLENRFPANPELPDNIDGIILLGGAIDPLRSYIWNQPEFGDAADRYIAFIELAKNYPEAALLFTGGAGTLLDQEYKEADVALYFLESMGIERSSLEVERDSRNTYENAVNSKVLVQAQPGENWILVTSATHMPRAMGVFCQQDWAVIPYPVDHQTAPGRQWRLSFNLADNLDSLNTHAREWAGLLAYFVSGKTTALLPGLCSLI